ncbi:sigma-70 family RNA polymerase sigma factor [Paludifilum halophilum]|uniref:RNA polymerase sigma-70 region 4 domain-containing protein n=1 Tax=Paludifilum halophilum TaxID=1642702 RepID=A0A235BBJ6_9BACL|nr:sigma-70 family RNA polymerase sigma factor [Paludifilum halophilum]OYD09646.1 hypothetical protein CHM34_01145 [Paludifilum halophilum]
MRKNFGNPARKKGFSDRLIRGFYQDPSHRRLQMEARQSLAKKRELEQSFREFCVEVQWWSYISKVIQHAARDKIQKQKKDQFQMPLILDQPIEEGSAETLKDRVKAREKPTGSLFAQVKNPDLFQSCEHLTDKQRQVLDLHYQQGLTFREIAKEMRVTPQAISKTHRNAVKILRQALEGGR